MDITVLVTERALQADLKAALRARRIGEKHFYDSPQSAEAWLALCRSTAYRNHARSMEILSREAGDLADRIPRGACWVGLGCGQADKDLVVLRQMAARAPAKDVPVFIAFDTSQWLLELALEAAASAGVPASGLKADLAVYEHLGEAARRAAGRPRVFALLGNTLGAIDYRGFLGALDPLLASDDLLIVDGEIYDEASVAGGYLNEDNLRFASAPLRSLGLTSDDGELSFETAPDPGGLDGLWLLRKRFVLARDVRLSVAGETIELSRGERIDMGYSCKYTPEALCGLLEGAGGLTVERRHMSHDGRFLVAVARRHRV